MAYLCGNVESVCVDAVLCTAGQRAADCGQQRKEGDAGPGYVIDVLKISTMDFGQIGRSIDAEVGMSVGLAEHAMVGGRRGPERRLCRWSFVEKF